MKKDIALYYNPKTQLYARYTQSNSTAYHYEGGFVWKELTKLFPRHQTKIAILNVAELKTKIPGIGRKRESRHHNGYFIYFFYKDGWKKELS